MDSNILFEIGKQKQTNKEYDEMIYYYELAIKQGHVKAMNNLGVYYNYLDNITQNDIDKMKYYYLLAINNNNVTSMYNLGLYYKTIKDFDNMLKYFLMAINNKCQRSKDSISKLIKDLDKPEDIYSLYFALIKYKHNNIINEFIIQIEKNKEFFILRNVINKWGKKDTCSICLEDDTLVIPRMCTHEYCTSCYVKMLDKCAFCKF
jgi:tetratricopeptide (TPR) repeat protein